MSSIGLPYFLAHAIAQRSVPIELGAALTWNPIPVIDEFLDETVKTRADQAMLAPTPIDGFNRRTPIARDPLTAPAPSNNYLSYFLIFHFFLVFLTW
jgi:hypothetical protein